MPANPVSCAISTRVRRGTSRSPSSRPTESASKPWPRTSSFSRDALDVSQRHQSSAWQSGEIDENVGWILERTCEEPRQGYWEVHIEGLRRRRRRKREKPK